MKIAWHSGRRRIIQAFLISSLITGLMLSQVAAAPIIPNLPTNSRISLKKVENSETGRYFIFFDGESALQATRAKKGQIQSASVQNQVAGVRAFQIQELKTIEKLIGRKLQESKHFDLILNAVAVPLSLEEAVLIASLPGVKDVLPVRTVELATDAGPAWVGAPQVWDDPVLTASKVSMGEGVIIGMLDTGINFDHPSFASDSAFSGDTSGYVFPVPAHYFGVCDDPTSQFFGKCNDKLIGAYSMTRENLLPNSISPEDDNGHGSHTASTAAGNRAITVNFNGVNTKISGMAPRAQIIAFDVCKGTSCLDDAIVEAVQQALHDGVGVISYSISSMNGPYVDPIELAFLEAFKANIFIAAAAANSYGPTNGLVNHQGPWVSTVAATSHNRRFLPGPDIRASFSLQGPAAGGLEVIKPDLAAPGLFILAANKDGRVDENHSREVYLENGTSMSTPFVAGAAALLISAHPDWTPAEVKSALMLTAKTAGMQKDTAGTPADPFDIGSGRIQIALANATGLVMDETGVNMTNANPEYGGDPKTLNLPTMQNNFCLEACSWTRTVRSTNTHAVTYTVVSPSWVIVEPSQFTITPGAWQSLRITAHTTGKPLQAWYFGQVDLTPDTLNASLPAVHFTTAVYTPIPYYFPYIIK